MQCRCDNNGKSVQNSIAVATSTLAINGTTRWQQYMEVRGNHTTVNTSIFAKKRLHNVHCDFKCPLKAKISKSG